MSDADVCRKNGWGPGTYLQGDEGHGPEIILITAVGEASILAKLVYTKGKRIAWPEGSWTLALRDWKQVWPTTEGYKDTP
jgi:hypothetical protein